VLRWVPAFFVLALIASAFGFLCISTAAVSNARVLVFGFLALFPMSVVGACFGERD
jgi:uncharacterized membrane protein YtjA (UPF0391 family)